MYWVIFKLGTNSHNVTRVIGQLRSLNTAWVTLHGLGHTPLFGSHYTAHVQLHGLGHSAWLGSFVWVWGLQYTTPPAQVTQNSRLGHSAWLMHSTQNCLRHCIKPGFDHSSYSFCCILNGIFKVGQIIKSKPLPIALAKQSSAFLYTLLIGVSDDIHDEYIKVYEK